jgi:hypothetical protein
MDRYGEYDDENRGYRERRSSNKSTLVVLGVGALALGVCMVVCGGFVYLAAKKLGDGMSNFGTAVQQAAQQAQQQQESLAAQATAEAFMQDVAAGNTDAAYARTTKSFQARQTGVQFRDFVNQNPVLKNYQLDSLDDPEFTTPLSATFDGAVLGPNGDVTFTLVLTKDGQGWKVDRFTIP